MTVAQTGDRLGAGEGKGDGALVGARKRERLDESLGALSANLNATDLEQIERAVPADAAVGARYTLLRWASEKNRKTSAKKYERPTQQRKKQYA